MGDKKRIDEWYAKLNKQFEEDRKTHDFSDPEMDKWFYAMLDDKMRMKDKKGTEEWDEEIHKQFEEDSKTHDYSDLETDRIFAEMLDEHFKKDRKRRIAKVTGIAAGIVLALSVALNGFTEVAYGQSLFEIIKNSIEAGQFTISALSQIDVSQFEKYDEDTIRYESDSIDGIFEQIKTDEVIKVDELFYVTDMPDQYQHWIAEFNTKFETLTVNSKFEDNYLYIYEELDYENLVSGTILETEIVSTIFNENLQMDINIVVQMDNVRLQGYYIEVFYNNKRLRIEGNGTLEEFEIIAKNISLSKGNRHK